MKKNYAFILLIFIITSSCDNKEDSPSKSQLITNPTQTYIINEDIEYTSEITDGSKPNKPILVFDIPNKTDEVNSLTSKTSVESVFFNFNYGIAASTKSGCTVTRYTQSGKTYETDAGVYGPNPYTLSNGYLIRGFGVPHQNISYNSLVMIASNRGNKLNTRRGIWHENIKRGSAISIEYAFKKDVTYEIIIKAIFHDNRYSLDKVFSSGYPILYAQLKDNGIIILPNERGQNQDPCEREDLNDIKSYAYDYINYTRSFSPDSHVEEQKTIIFKFSPTIEKNALLISLHPTIGIEGYGLPIPTNSYTMLLPSITISEKPFDPSLNVDVPTIPYDRDGGRR